MDFGPDLRQFAICEIFHKQGNRPLYHGVAVVMKRTAGVLVSMLVAGAASLPAQARPAAAPARPAAAPAAAPASRPVPGNVVRVRMQQNGARYTFDPANLTIKQGDIVEFVNVSGFPHNVGFEATKIPAGAADVLNRNMAQKVGALLGPMMTAPNQAYRVSFAGAPTGTYAFYCLPHKAMGMVGVITVQAGTPRR